MGFGLENPGLLFYSVGWISLALMWDFVLTLQ
jgi:hypothetical protein